MSASRTGYHAAQANAMTLLPGDALALQIGTGEEWEERKGEGPCQGRMAESGQPFSIRMHAGAWDMCDRVRNAAN